MSESPVQISEKPESILESLFREYAERYIAIYNKYAKEETKTDEEFIDMIERRNDEIDKLDAEFTKRLKNMNLDVELHVGSDSINYFNAPGYPRAYNYFRIFEDNKVVDKKNKKVYIVTIVYSELRRPVETEYVFDDLKIEEYTALGDDTPFANALDANTPWLLIRNMYVTHILDYISEIAEAERSGKLEEKLKEIKEQVEKSLWIYDYEHFYNALMKTAQQFNISL